MRISVSNWATTFRRAPLRRAYTTCPERQSFAHQSIKQGLSRNSHTRLHSAEKIGWRFFHAVWPWMKKSAGIERTLKRLLRPRVNECAMT